MLRERWSRRALDLAVAWICGLVCCACVGSSRPKVDPPSNEDLDSAVRADVVDYLSLRERPWVVDRWGLTRGESLKVDGERLQDGRFRIRVASSHGFSGTTVTLELELLDEKSVHAEVTVTNWSDEGPPTNWKKPTGWIGVSSIPSSPAGKADRSSMILELRLHDEPMQEDTCFHGVVEVAALR
jgi:hypothetical protein